MNNPVQRTEWTMTYILDNFTQSKTTFSEFSLRGLDYEHMVEYGSRYFLVAVTKREATIMYGPSETIDWESQ